MKDAAFAFVSLVAIILTLINYMNAEKLRLLLDALAKARADRDAAKSAQATAEAALAAAQANSAALDALVPEVDAALAQP